MSRRIAGGTPVCFTANARHELQWWSSLSHAAPLTADPPGRALADLLHHPTATMSCFTDASSDGLGAFFAPVGQVNTAGGSVWLQLWVPHEFRAGKRFHWLEFGANDRAPLPLPVSSGWLEAAAVLAAVRRWGPGPWRGHAITLYCDNESVGQM